MTPPIATPPSLAAVYAALGTDRLPTLAAARALGCDLDRWRRQDWLALAAAITALEDAVEGGRECASRDARRAELRTVRRALEDAGEVVVRRRAA